MANLPIVSYSPASCDMPSDPKHLAISRKLLADISSGKYGPGDRLPSETQLVKTFRVSRPTIARGLQDLEAEGLIERRAGSGTYVRTTPAVPPSLRQLALLIPGLGNTEIFELISGELASQARVHGYSLLWGSSTAPRADADPSIEHATELCEQFIARRVSGVFFAPFELTHEKEGASRRLAEALRQAGIPVVFLDRDVLPFPIRSDFDVVGIDNIAGGFLLADHLVKLGCKRIAFVARPNSAPTVDARIAGAREALVRHGLEVPRNWVHIGDPASSSANRVVRICLAEPAPRFVVSEGALGGDFAEGLLMQRSNCCQTWAWQWGKRFELRGPSVGHASCSGASWHGRTTCHAASH